jgi:hypothetical protein
VLTLKAQPGLYHMLFGPPPMPFLLVHDHRTHSP